MASIRVTPEDLESQGNELIGFAGDLADVLNSIDSKINEIIDGWDGLSQDAYYDMYTTMKQSLGQVPGTCEFAWRRNCICGAGIQQCGRTASEQFQICTVE